MKEVKIGKNDSGQRMDRFLKKFLAKAPQGFIYKMLRKKRIKLNNKRVKPKDIIEEGDIVQFYLANETINKFIEEKEEIKSSMKLDIIYEDKNVLLINKPKGVLSHSANNNGDNIVDGMIAYLIDKKDYDPQKEKTFIPAICNRLDRNTSGIIIGAKNYSTLKNMNEYIKKGYVKKYYKCMVLGNIDKEIVLKDYLIKDKASNKVAVMEDRVEGAKAIWTVIRPLKIRQDYSLLEVDLITGRTHQIRAHLASIGYPIVGDRKYGDKKVNNYFKEKYNLKSQFLHGYKVVFNNLSNNLKYLNGKGFVASTEKDLTQIEKKYFG